MTSRPPDSSAWHSSQNARSKPVAANASTREWSPTPSRSVWVSISLATPLWVSTTPFGRPVEPDVWIT